MRGSRISETHRHTPGHADAAARNRVGGSEAEGGVGGERRPLSRQLGLPTDRQYRRFSYSETQRARMTRRPFSATLASLADNEGFARFSLRIKGVEFLLEALLRGL